MLYLQNGSGASEIDPWAKVEGSAVRCMKDIKTSVSESKTQSNLIAYPNPASNKLYLKIFNSEKFIVRVYDLQGKQVLQKQLDSNFIDISGLSNGLYLVEVFNYGKVHSFKICINHRVP